MEHSAPDPLPDLDCEPPDDKPLSELLAECDEVLAEIERKRKKGGVA
jgi:hypothetical protein